MSSCVPSSRSVCHEQEAKRQRMATEEKRRKIEEDNLMKTEMLRAKTMALNEERKGQLEEEKSKLEALRQQVALQKQEISLERKGVEAEKRAVADLRKNLKEAQKSYKEEQRNVEAERQRTEIAKNQASPERFHLLISITCDIHARIRTPKLAYTRQRSLPSYRGSSCVYRPASPRAAPPLVLQDAAKAQEELTRLRADLAAAKEQLAGMEAATMAAEQQAFSAQQVRQTKQPKVAIISNRQQPGSTPARVARQVEGIRIAVAVLRIPVDPGYVSRAGQTIRF
eukprot:631398-Prorocentrum_minimum.AAC.2